MKPVKMGRFETWILLSLVTPYAYGVLSGWYADHPNGAPISKSNPDTFIHSGLWFVSSYLIAKVVLWANYRIKARKAAKQERLFA